MRLQLIKEYKKPSTGSSLCLQLLETEVSWPKFEYRFGNPADWQPRVVTSESPLAMSHPLQTTWQVERDAGEPAAVIRVRNLQLTIEGPQDAWGRQGRPQPMLISAEASLSQPFGSSSSTDVVASDTVHYGLLSKAILGTIKQYEETKQVKSMSLYAILDVIWANLTGFYLNGIGAHLEGKKPFLSLDVMRSLRVKVDLPKASLLGSAVSLSGMTTYESDGCGNYIQGQALALTLKELRVPTLIGVNDNERLAKQVVVANITLERFRDYSDNYTQLEAVVVEVSSRHPTDIIKLTSFKAMAESSYETLEALASDLALKITQHLRAKLPDVEPKDGCQIIIGLEKPTAVPLADAACVELRTNTRDVLPVE